jgi:hypothetical protein
MLNIHNNFTVFGVTQLTFALRNHGLQVFLFLTRSAYFLGLFGPDNVPGASLKKKAV